MYVKAQEFPPEHQEMFFFFFAIRITGQQLRGLWGLSPWG